MLRPTCILGGPQSQAQGAKSEVATSPLPSRGPKRGRKCYATPTSSGVPNAKRRGQNQKWPPHPCLLGGPKEGGNATSNLHSRGSPTPSAGSKIRSGYLRNATSSLHSPGSRTPSEGSKIRRGCHTLAFSGAQKRVEMQRHPYVLRGPGRQAQRAKSEVVPTKAQRNQKCLTHPCFLGVQKRAEMLRHPCILGGPQHQARGARSEMATPLLRSRGPKRGRKCYVTPTFSVVLNAKRKEQNQKWLSHHWLLRGPKEGGNATSSLHSPGSPTPSAGSIIRSGPQQRGTKSEVATSPLPSRGPKGGRKCYVIPAFSGVPDAKRKEQNQKWLPHPCLLGGPKEGANATPPMHSRGSPTPSAGNKIRIGYLTLAISRAQKRAEMLRRPRILGGPQRQAQGAKSEGAAASLPSWGPKRGRKCYVTLAFSGVPNAKRGEQNQKWLPHPCLLGGPKEGANATPPMHSRGSPTPSAGNKIRIGYLTLAISRAQKRAEMLRRPRILGGPQRQAQGAKSEGAAASLPSWGPKRGRKCYVTLAFSGVPNAKRGEQNQKWLPHPCLLGGPKEGGNATSPPYARGSPTPSAGSKIRRGCRTLAFSGAQKRAEMLRNPCILGGSQRQARGAKSELGTSPLPSRGPKRGRKCYIAPVFSGVPNAKRREK